LQVFHRLFWLTLLSTWSFTAQAIDIESPRTALADVPLEIAVSDVAAGTPVSLTFAGTNYMATADDEGRAVFSSLSTPTVGTTAIEVTAGEESASSDLRVLPGWVSVMPAFLAILVALLVRNVVPAILLGLWLGATALIGFSPYGIGKGILDVFGIFIVEAFADSGRVSIIVFTMMIGGMVGIITRNGGMASIVRVVVSKAKTAVGGQVSVWMMGLMVFFDDYANTLVVGNTARPITDHLKISREKLAYIVDSTAAPVVCLALITTWIGYQVSLIDQAMKGIDGLSGTSAYSLFLNSIPYSFYPILAIVFVLAVAVTGRDFGPMYKAELRAREGMVKPQREAELPAVDSDSLEAKPDTPMRPVNALLPIIVLITTLLVSIYVTGEGDSLRDVIGSSDPYVAMLWASSLAVIVAAGLSIGQRILTLHETVDAWYGGLRATLLGVVVLVLAWSMADVTNALDAKGYLILVLGDTLPLQFVPAVVFLLAAITAFATGTSWGTMGILLPLVLPLTWAVMTVSGVADASGMHIMHSSIACVLAGAVWGDHCSPISDTTVLSSIASGCDHIEHVRTQLPYAILVGTVAVAIGTVPGGYGMPPWISIIAGIVILVGALRYFGRKA
jgi:Na+/H+ antiporter NhaC